MDDEFYTVVEQKSIDDNIMANHLLVTTWFFVCLTISALILHWAGVI